MIEFTVKDIVDNELCTGCGLCVSESESINTMKWNEDGFLVPDIIGTISDDSIKVCPFNPEPEIEVKDEDKLAELFLIDARKTDVKLGKYIETYVGYSERHRETSSSGGVATYVFEQLLKNNYVQHLFVVKEAKGTYEYQLFSEVSKIREISKTRYIPVTLEKLFSMLGELDGRVAVSGVACFIKAIRLKQYYHPELKEKISFLVGIICGGLKSRFYTDFLAQSAGITNEYSSQDYRIKDFNGTASGYGFGAYDKNEIFFSMKMAKVGDMWGTGLFKSNACDFCDDVTTELADISLGDAWIPPYRYDGKGTSILITRSPLAEKLIKDGIERGDLCVQTLSKDRIIESQAAGFKHRQQASKFRLDQNLRQGKLIPYKRARFFQRIPLEFKIVQKERRLLRYLSIKLWRESSDLASYNQKLLIYKRRLKLKTKVYHKIQRMKFKLKMKTL